LKSHIGGKASGQVPLNKYVSIFLKIQILSEFLYEGTLRKNAVKNGAVLDMELYSLVNEYSE
jgi:hypothetical protein